METSHRGPNIHWTYQILDGNQPLNGNQGCDVNMQPFDKGMCQ